MRKVFLATVFLSLFLGGCLSNGVKEIPPSQVKPSATRGVVVLGFGKSSGVERAFGRIQQVDPETGRITGNCSTWNRIELDGPVEEDIDIRAYSVPPGYYGANVQGGSYDRPFIFRAPANEIVYAGDFRFIRVENGYAQLAYTSDIDRARSMLPEDMAALLKNAERPDIGPVSLAIPLCTP